MSVTPENRTLEDLISQQLNLGIKDPHRVYDELQRLLGPDELMSLAGPYLPDLVSYMARQRLNEDRRREVAKISPATLNTQEVMLKSLWVPHERSREGGESTEATYSYKRVADMTDADFDARAAYLERMVGAITRHAQWCREVAVAIRTQRCGVAGKLSMFPELPESV